MRFHRITILGLTTAGIACLLLFISYRLVLVSMVIHQLERHGSGIGSDHVPGLGPTTVTIGIHTPGTAPAISSETACFLLSKLHVFWRLRCLNLNNVKVDQRCIVSALQNTHLTELRANGTSFDDACVLAAVSQGSLELLSVRSTLVTPDGLRALSSLR